MYSDAPFAFRCGNSPPASFSSSFSLGTARGSDWTVIKFRGRDYVTLENVATFYDLGEVHRAGNEVTMSNGSRSLRGTLGSGDFYINSLKFNLSYPLENVDGKLLVSRMDLSKVIEPVLRPSRIKGADLVDTVVLDPGHGGHDNGATSIFGNEKPALDVALRTRTSRSAWASRFAYDAQRRHLFHPAR